MPLYIINIATEDTHGHDNLLPPSTLIDLLQALQKKLEYYSSSNQINIEQDLHLSILETLTLHFLERIVISLDYFKPKLSRPQFCIVPKINVVAHDCEITSIW
jgi:hypothetical protein